MDVEPAAGQKELQSGWFEIGKEEAESGTDKVVFGVDFEHLTGLMIEHRLGFEDA